jgi:insulysin
MIIPKNETRIFDVDVLENGIKTSYVYDKDTDKTSVTVSVAVGSYSNPKEYQGLAHFLEHMLFLGSEKYPNEEYYEINVKKYGGSSNAWTDMFETVYYFSVFNDGIEHLMDIFSRFFIDPLFNEDAVQREINAVNSEHQKNINDDHWRIFQIIKNIAKKENKFNTFATGSNKTMDKNSIRNAMIDFYENFYVSENLSISIVSNLDINQQKKMVKSTFGLIPTKKTKQNINIQKPIYANFDKTFQIIPLSDIQKLVYIWEINQGFSDKNKIYEIINEILVSGYKNSFAHFLKVNGLAESCYVNIDKDVGIFTFYINLTKVGLTKLNQIDGYLKHTMNFILSSDLSEYIEYYKKVYQINFDNSDKEESLELSNMLAINAHKYPAKEILSGPYLIKKLDGKINNIIKQEFSKCIKILISQEDNINSKLTDPNYGTVYGEITNINSSPIPFDLLFSVENPFLDLQIQNIKLEDNISTPILIRDRFWYAGITRFGEPVIKGALIFNNPKFFETSKAFVYTILAINCLSSYLNQELFNIYSIKYNLSISSRNIYNSIVLSYSCLNDPIKLNQFIIKTLQLIKSPQIPEKIIESKIMSLKENYLNINKENPWDYSSYYLETKTISNEYSNEVILQELEKINKDKLLTYISSLFDDSSLSVLFSGAISIDQLPNNQLINKLTLLPQNGFPQIKLPENIVLTHPNKEEQSNCVTIKYDIGNFEPNKWIHTFLTYLILEQPFFDELRTKKQLGYLVRFSMVNTGDNYYLLEKVQSEKDCKYLLNEINQFNKKILNIIDKINLEEWKITAKNYLDEKDNSTYDIYNRFFSEIISRKYLFNRKKILIQQIANVTIESLQSFIKVHLLENKKKCTFELNGN